MSKTLGLTIIIPVYNAKKYILNCINSILNQNIKTSFEILVIDDASTDNSIDILKELNSPFVKIHSLKLNSGPASARNVGLKMAKGEYIFFLDADDTLSNNSLNILFSEATMNSFDLVICDKKLIENQKNKRENNFIYSADKTFDDLEITNEIIKRIHNPLYQLGLIGLTGRLIKNSIIVKHNIHFQEKLRYLEDEIFSWDVLSHCKKIKYVRKQLYSYYVYPNESSGISEGIKLGFPIENFKTAKRHVFNCLINRKLETKKSEKLADQAFIFFIISALVSFSRSIIIGKVNFSEGNKKRKEMIKNILTDPDVKKAIKNYKSSKNENKWIPLAINWRLNKILEFLCHARAKEILTIRQKSE